MGKKSKKSSLYKNTPQFSIKTELINTSFYYLQKIGLLIFLVTCCLSSFHSKLQTSDKNSIII